MARWLSEGAWKYSEAGRGARKNLDTNTELGNDPGGLLYDLPGDLAETRNGIGAEPDQTNRLKTTLGSVLRRQD